MRWLILAVLLWLPIGAQAQMAQASSPWIDSYSLRELAFWHTLGPHQVYLVITASGGGTDVLALAPPQTAGGPTLAHALATALQGTPLRGQKVEWQAGDWTEARAHEAAGRVGAWQAVNTVPVGTIAAGLHSSGFSPLMALCVPHVAFAGGLSAPFATDDVDNWYDLSGSHAPSLVRVRDSMSSQDIFVVLLPFLGLPLLALLGVALGTWSIRGRERTRKERSRFDGLGNAPLFVGWIAWMVWGGTQIGQRSPLEAIADVWFGVTPSLSTDFTSVQLISVVVWVGLCSLIVQRQKMRLFGPSDTVPAAAMTRQERTFQERSNLGAGVIMFLSYPAAFAVVALNPGWPKPARFLAFPIVLCLVNIPLIIYLQKKSKAFVTQTADAALTDIARRFGTRPGFPAPEVMIMQSARTQEYAYLENQPNGRIAISQKLADKAASEEMAFLIAHQVALGRMRIPSPWLRLAPFLAILVFGNIAVAAAPHWLFGPGFWALIALAACLIVAILWIGELASPKKQEARLREADQYALEQTGNLAAAVRALEILREYAPLGASGNPSGLVAREIKMRLAALQASGLA